MLLAKMLIRNKILYTTLFLLGTMAMLIYCSLRGVYAYRDLVVSTGLLSSEFREVWSLNQHINDMRAYLHPSRDAFEPLSPSMPSFKVANDRAGFLIMLDFVQGQLESHENRIRRQIIASDPLLATSDLELEKIQSMRVAASAIKEDMYQTPITGPHHIDEQLEELSLDLHELANFLTSRMASLRDEVRARYRAWQVMIYLSAAASVLSICYTFRVFRLQVVQPFKVLLTDSRAIAAGKFEHRIKLKSQDELAELGDAMNRMTDRFVEIKNNLNATVQQRTREVVRSEQLASVGFLAAGVAHEINNPLASIAWSAESLESRLHEVLHGGTVDGEQGETSTPPSQPFDPAEIEILRKYLRRIQEEAFRCKGITERLLDFSRLGESQKREETDVHELVSDVIALVKHLGQYRNRSVEFSGTPGIRAKVSPTELKQVVLNLLTNALDASQDGDAVRVTLEARGDDFVLSVADRGCGMTPEVLEHLFEPFFTRRRDGRGTGLGLSITYRIVEDHGGKLVPTSEGPGRGATLELTMPIEPKEEENYERRQAA